MLCHAFSERGQPEQAQTGPSDDLAWLGVSLRANGRWVAQIGYQGRSISLGEFKREIDAARAYDRKKRELFGEFAKLNFPEEQ